MAPLSPLDLLTLSNEEQLIVRCLNQRPHLTAAQIAEATRIGLPQLELVLGHMVREARLEKQLHPEPATFAVRFAREKPKVRHAVSLFEL